jgi:hypothetical protein
MILFHAPAGEGLGRKPTPRTEPRSSNRLCRETFVPVHRSRRHITHTCDRPKDHTGPHHCPRCRTDWSRPDKTQEDAHHA